MNRDAVIATANEMGRLSRIACGAERLSERRAAVAIELSAVLVYQRSLWHVPLICGAADPAAELRDWWLQDLRAAGMVPAVWMPSWWIMAGWLLPYLLRLAVEVLRFWNALQDGKTESDTEGGWLFP